ncbi:hypothetical protein GJW-30_1_01414 [Variibacter gotjawalensis]|uniref:Uncharacterized protein n=1 Tax=Variibacter gotjawalensis TaxID=1333996 RepID=A0A0S3PSF6_9BRAD|nr:hypothetical protein [Variibacter gotjawalensis]NIK49198.1 hypothetical protein [Variibacter gotjawalensis]RZS51052.1 hypothetical protein EV661_3525 [Variibacter gotjawalensis]BAT58886.1 hypothetical protein GJW-30_1_01414 [Variibacter gotjawalensis]
MAAPLRNQQAFDEIIGQLYSAGTANVADVLASASDIQKARLALFCYERAHMRAIGLAVAATCDPAALIEAGGKLGEAIYAQARTGTAPIPAPARRSITLATPTPSMPVIVDEDPDPEFYAEAG